MPGPGGQPETARRRRRRRAHPRTLRIAVAREHPARGVPRSGRDVRRRRPPGPTCRTRKLAAARHQCRLGLRRAAVRRGPSPRRNRQRRREHRRGQRATERSSPPVRVRVRPGPRGRPGRRRGAAAGHAVAPAAPRRRRTARSAAGLARSARTPGRPPTGARQPDPAPAPEAAAAPSPDPPAEHSAPRRSGIPSLSAASWSHSGGLSRNDVWLQVDPLRRRVRPATGAVRRAPYSSSYRRITSPTGSPATAWPPRCPGRSPAAARRRPVAGRPRGPRPTPRSPVELPHPHLAVLVAAAHRR